MISRAIFVSDHQMPHQDPRAVEIVHLYLKHLIQRAEQVDMLIVGGDLVDLKNLSTKFLNSQVNRRSVIEEFDMAKLELATLAQLTPKARHVFIGGNHEQRLRTYIRGLAPELEVFMNGGNLSFDKLFELQTLKYEPYIEYPGIFEYKGMTFKHGDFTGGTAGKNELKREGSSGMSGHLHQYRVHAETNRKGSHAWFHAPCLCNVRGDNMPPGSHQGVQDWTQGFMEILFYDEADKKRIFQVNPIIITEGQAITPDGRLLSV